MADLEYKGNTDIIFNIAKYLPSKITAEDFSGPDICTLSSSFVLLDFKMDAMLLRIFSRKLKYKLRSCSKKDLLNFIWAMAKSEWKKLPSVYQRISEEIFPKMKNMTNTEIIQFTFGFSRVCFLLPNSYLMAVESKLVQSLDDLDYGAEDVSKMLYFLAQSDFPSEKLIKFARAHFLTSENYSVSEICNYCWAISILGHMDMEILQKAYFQIKSNNEELLIDQKQKLCHSLLQAFFSHCIKSSDGNESYLEILEDSEFWNGCLDVWRNSQELKMMLKSAGDIVECCERLGYKEYRPELNRYEGENLNIKCKNKYEIIEKIKNTTLSKTTIKLKSKEEDKIAIDIVLLNHCHCNIKEKVLPSRSWALRLYGNLGYQMVRIREEDWIQVLDENKINYLKRKLNIEDESDEILEAEEEILKN